MLKRRAHTPPHLFEDNALYFITGAILEKRHLLKPIEIKRLLWKQIAEYFEKYRWELHHWVILENHYHLMGKSKWGKDLSRVMKGIHDFVDL